MAQKGICKDKIIAMAVQMVEQSGEPEISMRELAEQLNVKTPSLYNHIKSMEELLSEVSRYAAEQLKEAQLAAMSGKKDDEAVVALATVYRAYAKEHKGLYKAIMASSHLTTDSGHPSSEAMMIPVLEALSQFDLSEKQMMHWQRILRSIMHGFVAHENAGFFRHDTADSDDSFLKAIHCFLNGMKAEREEQEYAG